MVTSKKDRTQEQRERERKKTKSNRERNTKPQFATEFPRKCQYFLRVTKCSRRPQKTKSKKSVAVARCDTPPLRVRERKGKR